jgi:glycyl-tRNA synthetase
MQEALLSLTAYWSQHGCMVAQPMNTEVGAGTLNPATFLRVLGPEPWRVAYVEPSVRPDDARYGENPNRIQTHTQFQVILKPEPGDAQELYLGSLAALGVDLSAHDVRFVEDNWASPALGAWGLGWEVWLDGLEITQFTYFQQAGGLPLDPVSVEITYGIERVMMALQGVRHFADISYAPGISYGEAFGQAEYEMSRYYIEDADIAINRSLFEAYAAEAGRLIGARLPVAAHTFVLKCSHAFNVLDARGAISPTERARAFGRMRGLARQVAELWTARREELAHPLGVAEPPPAARPITDEAPVPSGRATFTLEIGVEELPPGEVTRSVEWLAAILTERLAATRLRHGVISTFGSPRRLIAMVEEVAPQENDVERTIRGPRLADAYHDGGRPTRAAQGFARGQGVDVSDLTTVTGGGAEYVAVVQRVRGRRAVDVLGEILPGVVAGLRAERNMRWSAPGLSFARPVRWLLALLGEAVVPFAVSSLASGRLTRVHRSAPEPVVAVASAGQLLDVLARHGICADAAYRRRTIVTGAQQLAALVGGMVDIVAEAALVDEITNLVEQPEPVLAEFDERYLELPAEVLTAGMRKQQRYLPVRARGGALLPYFVVVTNGSCDEERVCAGNEAVLRARYEDAAFFWRADLQTPPEQMRRRLPTLTFQEQLGSMADRVARIAAVVGDLSARVDLSAAERSTLARASELAKFDLASHLVVELPSLGGVMAREYAKRAGEPEPVATALFELELPRHAGDQLPETAPGALLAISDRLDLLTGLFALGAGPTGRSDPFALRRAAVGVVSILRTQPRLAAVSLDAGLAAAAAQQPVPVSDEARAQAREFIVRRYEQQLLDAGYDHRLVGAVRPLAGTPTRADAALAELVKRMGNPAFGRLTEAVQRIRRIVPAHTQPVYDPARFEEQAEQWLDDAYAAVRKAVGDGPADLAAFADAATELLDPVDSYFVDVLVMAEDAEVRRNRLGHLAAIARLAEGLLDWDLLGGRGSPGRDSGSRRS